MSHSTTAAPAFLALACVGFFASAPAHAQPFAATASDAANDPTADDQDPTAQQGQQDRSQIVVKGTRLERELQSSKATRPLLDTPQTVTVLTEETLKKQNLLTLRDALTTIPGITFGAGEGGGGYGDSINLRGYSASNDLTIDGVRDSAQYNRTDPFNLEAIEVYSGASSAMSGAGSVGGTINLAQKRPFGANRTVVEAGVGTDDYYRATIDTNRRLSDFVAIRLNAMVHKNDVPGLDVVGYERWGVAPSIKLGVDGPTSLTLTYLHQEDSNIPVYGVPYYVTLGGLLPGAKYGGYYGYANVDKQDITVDQATAIFESRLAQGVSITNLSRWQRVSQDTTVNPPQGTYCLADGTTPTGAACGAGQLPGYFYPAGPRGVTRRTVNQLFHNQTDLRAEFGTGGLRHTLVIGASATQEDYTLVQGNVLRDADGNSVPLPPIEIANPDTRYAGPINFTPQSRTKAKVTNIAAYVFDTVAVTPWLELTGAARIERNDAEAVSQPLPEIVSGVFRDPTISDSEDTLFSYRGAVTFKPSASSALYFSYSNSETPPLESVRANCNSSRSGDYCDVAPEKAVSYELGGKASVAGGRLLLTAAIFRNERTNYRVPSADPTLPDPQVLDGRARVNGVALGASGNITRSWSLFANYTYLDSKVIQGVSDFCRDNPAATGCGPDVSAGRPLENTPKHSGSLFTTYTLPFGLQVGYGLTYQGSFTLINDNAAALYTVPDYLIHRAYLSYDFGNGLTGQVNVTNLTDERYFTGVRNTTSAWAVPGEGRSARFTLFYSF